MKVLVGMSGGVDSSVTALLLKEQGYEVYGATMKLLDNDATVKMINDAKDVCNQIGIKHYVFDFVNDFKNIVIKDFMDNYKLGLTPNPCVICNKEFKFKRFYLEAKKLGMDLISTGHYVNVKDGKLKKSDADKKDQSYFLWNIDKDILNHAVFPLGIYDSKEKVRKIASLNNLSVAHKKDSQDICFIEKDYTDFLEKNFDKLPDKGNIVHTDGTILGKHKGLFYYTIGQRKGLNISYSKPLYVIDLDGDKNELIVGDNKDLFNNSLIATNINLLVDELPNTVYCKIRSRSEAEKANIEYIGNDIKVTFDKPVRAITKGQSAVFYKDNICLGGGIIKSIN